jgi:hypothetical protein
MTKMEWQKGPPPEMGWYPTRVPPYTNWTNSYRWWDGKAWSWAAFPHESSEKAGRWAKKKETNFVSNQIMWSKMK